MKVADKKKINKNKTCFLLLLSKSAWGTRRTGSLKRPALASKQFCDMLYWGSVTGSMSASHSTNLFTNVSHHISTNGIAPLHSHINQQHPTIPLQRFCTAAMLDGRNNRFFFPAEQMFFLMQIILIVLPFNMAAVQNLYSFWRRANAPNVIFVI